MNAAYITAALLDDREEIARLAAEELVAGYVAHIEEQRAEIAKGIAQRILDQIAASQPVRKEGQEET